MMPTYPPFRLVCRRIAALAVLSALLAGAANKVSAAAAQLLTNGTFESGSTGWTIQGTSAGATVAVDGTNRYEGGQGVTIIDGTVDQPRIKQTVSVAASKRYVLHLWGKNLDYAGTIPYMVVRQLNAGGTLLATRQISIDALWWRAYQMTIGPAGSTADFSFVAGTTQLEIILFGAANPSTTNTGKAAYDNILLSEAASFSNDLAIFAHGFPKDIRFRGRTEHAEYFADYTAYRTEFLPHDALFPKAMNEEINPPFTNANGDMVIDFISSMKGTGAGAVADKMVICHFNGRARNPDDALLPVTSMYPGHWLYHEGLSVTGSLSAAATTIQFAGSPNLPVYFKLNVGAPGPTQNEDLIIVQLNGSGQPIWSQSEQVKLVSVNNTAKTITVQRGQYGSSARAYSGSFYVAAHVNEGPWAGTQPRLLWAYNYSTNCPVDASGRQLIDVLSDDLSASLLVGDLAPFDGIEFDVMYSDPPGTRPFDSNGDLISDNGLDSAGVNAFGKGNREFLAKLRQKVGASKLILADGFNSRHQRGYGLLNGIESEVFYDHGPDWSGNMNQFSFWKETTLPPNLNYCLLKSWWSTSEWNKARWALACVLMWDGVTASFNAERPNPDWAELIKGQSNQYNWLGQPLGPPVRLAKSATDLFNGEGLSPLTTNFMNNKVSASGAAKTFFTFGATREIRIDDTDDVGNTVFTLTGIPTGGHNAVTVFCTFRSAPLAGYPVGYARRLKASATTNTGAAVPLGLSNYPASDLFVVSSNDLPGTVNDCQAEQSFQFDNIPSGTTSIEVRFEVEGAQNVFITNITAHQSPDAVYRKFQNGLVLANGSRYANYTFNLGNVWPGQGFHRLLAHANATQDTATNNGAAIAAGSNVTVPMSDALFLAKP